MGTVKYSGPVASFHCPTNAEIRSLKVHFSPKQLGEGTPSPENVREIVGWDGVKTYQTGKNIWDEEWESGYLNTTTGLNTTSPNQIRAKNYIPLLSNTIYTVKALSKGTIWACFFDSDKAIIKNYTPTNLNRSVNVYAISGKTFTTPNNCAYMRFYFTEAYGKIYNNDVMITVDSTAASYEPYHGSTTNYEFGVLGKNKLDKNSYKYLNGSIICFGGGTSSEPDGSLFLKAGTYTFSVNTMATAIFATNANKVNIVSATNTNTATFTLSESMAVRIGCFIQGATDEEMLAYNYQLELGSTATTYEPYDPNKTVYGGWVDLVSGEVCEKYNCIDLGTLNYTLRSNIGTGQFSANIGAQIGKLLQAKNLWTGFCSSYKYVGSYNNLKTVDKGVGYIYTEHVDVKDLSVTEDDASAIKSALNGVMLAYELATPKTYQLAPTQLQTFLGQNNIWSNADYVEVEYDLYETQTILARKQFIVANQPHVVKPAAAPLQNFVTDMAAPLKECKIHFSPIQEGSGDPSPDNVRAISGWNSIQVGLPSEYQRVEYIQNPERETAHINTDIIITEEVKFQVDFQLISSASTTGYFMGQWADTSFYLYLGAGLMFQTAFGCTWANSSLKGNNQRHVFTYQFIDGDLHLYDGETEILKKAFSASSSLPICVAGPVVSNGSNKSVKTFSSKIWKNGILIQNLIPCVRKSDREPGMYDTVTKTFYTNAGTGEFICGPDVNEPSLLIDWTNDVGTVYGGYLDLVKGEIVEEWHKIVADGVNVKANRGNYKSDTLQCYGGAIVYLNPVGEGDASNAFCDNLLLNSMTTIPTIHTYARGQMYAIFYLFPYSNYEEEPTATDIMNATNEWLQEHPTTIVYKLREPIHHPLTPQTLKTLRGTNNLYSNSNGNIELAYWTH